MDCSESNWKLLTTHTIRLFPPHFSSRASPCAIRFRFHYTNGWRYSAPLSSVRSVYWFWRSALSSVFYWSYLVLLNRLFVTIDKISKYEYYHDELYLTQLSLFMSPRVYFKKKTSTVIWNRSDSVFGIATSIGLEGPEFYPRCGWVNTTQPPVQKEPNPFPVDKAVGA